MVVVAQSCPTLATAWTVAHQAPLSDFPGKDTAVGCHFLFPGNLPDPGIKLRSPALQVDSSPAELQGKLEGIVCAYKTQQEGSWGGGSALNFRNFSFNVQILVVL